MVLPRGKNRYNRYLAVAARVVRRSLKEEQRIKAERRGEMELRFAKWDVRHPFPPPHISIGIGIGKQTNLKERFGRMG